MEKSLQNTEQLKRVHQLTCSLNDFEYQAIQKYCKKYKVKNRSKFMREALISTILKQFDKDYPKLFDV